MATTIAYLAIALIGFLLLGGFILLFSKIFDVPVFGSLLLPVKLIFILVLGFCVAYTMNGILATYTGLDLRQQMERFVQRYHPPTSAPHMDQPAR